MKLLRNKCIESGCVWSQWATQSGRKSFLNSPQMFSCCFLNYFHAVLAYILYPAQKNEKKKKTLYLFPLYSCAIFTQFHSAKSILVSGSQWMKRRLFTHCIHLFLSSSLRRTKYKTSLKFLPVIIFLLLWLLRAARRRLSTPEKINLFEANDITTNRSPQIGLQITKIRNYLQRENLPLGGNV